MLELLKLQDYPIRMFVYRDASGPLDIVCIQNIRIIESLEIFKYTRPSIMHVKQTIKLPKKYWPKIIENCTNRIIDMCKLILDYSLYYNEHADELDVAKLDYLKDREKTIDPMIEYIKIVSTIRDKLRYICENYKEEDAPSIYFDIGEDNMKSLNMSGANDSTNLNSV